MREDVELMQELERDMKFPSPMSTPPSKASNDHSRNHVEHKRWANDEALQLVQQIFLLQSQDPPRVVVFSGIDHDNGCSQICASVAETLALHSQRPVCLVDANFRSPNLPSMFGTTNHFGLTDALTRIGPIPSFMKPVGDGNLWLLSSGALASDSPRLLSLDRLRERLDELRLSFDFIIVDAPPLSRYSDAVVLAQQCDGLVLVLEADATRREAAAVVASNLRAANVPILAAVLNKRTFPIPEKIYRRL